MLSLQQLLSERASARIVDLLPPLLEPYSISEMMSVMNRIIELESTKRRELEELALSIVYDNFPIFLNNEMSVLVKAQLVDEITHPVGDDDGIGRASERKGPTFKVELLDEYRKRKMANMMTQGASISSHGIHHLADEFRRNNEELVNAYDQFDRMNMDVINRTKDSYIMSMSEESARSVGLLGESFVEFKDGLWIIHVKATLMPVLVHEIVKGMYELISMSGLPNEPEIRRSVLEYTDTTKNELMDCKYGKVLYGEFRDFVRGKFHDMTDNKPEVLEYYLQHIYEMSAPDMLRLMDDIILGEVNVEKERVVVRAIYNEIVQDDRDSHTYKDPYT